MNEKEFLQSIVYEEMMNRAQQCYDTVELRYDEHLDNARKVIGLDKKAFRLLERS